LGTAESVEYSPLQGQTEGLTMSFQHGNSSRSFEIDFYCDVTAGPGIPSYTNESPALHYNFIWHSQYACPVDGPNPTPTGGIGLGWILIIVGFTVFIIYWVAGILVLKFYKKNTGVDLIPNREFWSTLPGLVKDGVVWTFRKTKDLIDRIRNRNSGYTSITATLQTQQ